MNPPESCHPFSPVKRCAYPCYGRCYEGANCEYCRSPKGQWSEADLGENNPEQNDNDGVQTDIDSVRDEGGVGNPEATKTLLSETYGPHGVTQVRTALDVNIGLEIPLQAQLPHQIPTLQLVVIEKARVCEHADVNYECQESEEKRYSPAPYMPHGLRILRVGHGVASSARLHWTARANKVVRGASTWVRKPLEVEPSHHLPLEGQKARCSRMDNSPIALLARESYTLYFQYNMQHAPL